LCEFCRRGFRKEGGGGSFMSAVLFYSLGAFAVASALGVVTMRNPIRCVLSLGLCFLALAGIYLLSGAEFIAAIQVIVYVGAVMVLFLFVIMLLNLKEDLKAAVGSRFLVGGGLALGAVLLLEGLVLLSRGTPGAAGAGAGEAAARGASGAAEGSTQLMGRLLFSDYILAFEVASILLLVGIVGAVALLRRDSGEKGEDGRS